MTPDFRSRELTRRRALRICLLMVFLLLVITTYDSRRHSEQNLQEFYQQMKAIEQGVEAMEQEMKVNEKDLENLEEKMSQLKEGETPQGIVP